MASLDTPDKKKVLGRGLASLIPADGTVPMPQRKDFFLCDIEKIVPNTYQPRKIFEKGALEELVESVRTHGIIQPLVVRQRDGHYELIAGERRWRAAQKAGLKQVPVVIKDVTGDMPSLEMAIVENVQRENLNCIEEAIAYQQLMDEFQLSQEQIALRVGKNRVSIANTLRLLKLPAVIREDITAGRLTMGHARALLSIESAEQQIEMRDLIIRKKFSVRETERRVNDLLKRASSGQGTYPLIDPHLKALEDALRREYGSAVRVIGNNKRGYIQFTYSSMEDLMRLIDQLKDRNVSKAPGSV